MYFAFNMLSPHLSLENTEYALALSAKKKIVPQNNTKQLRKIQRSQNRIRRKLKKTNINPIQIQIRIRSCVV